ncbi:hypothetical protein DFH06DRAFT_1346531 [Mycena polygramma]|nr:hypothetical protein DFH06DRAFT_1346531 [Mycena polygramma]
MLEKKQDELEACLSLIIYPVLSLPVEITSHIFLCCLPTHGCVVPSPSNVPLLLAQICRHWRDVALNTPQLWNSICGEHKIPPYALFRSWLTRAKGSSLSLGLAESVPAATFDLILSYAGQIQNLDLRLSTEDFHRLCSSPLPRLQRLATNHVSYAALREISKHTPLRELRLRDSWYADISANLSFPLLTNLELAAEISTETFLDVMKNFPLLQHLKFRLSEESAHLATGTEGVIRIIFPHLLSLAFGNGYGVRVLRFVTLPSVRTIAITGYSDLEDVRSFLTRSSCAINHLIISFSSWEEVENPRELADWFSEFPSVSTLETTANPNCSPPFDLVIGCLDTPSMLPQLTDVIIAFNHEPPSVDHEAVVNMLSRRAAHHPRLKKFHIWIYQCFDNPWSPSPLVSAELQRMIVTGLEFVVHVEVLHRDESDDVWRWHTWPSTYVGKSPLHATLDESDFLYLL